MDLRTILCKYTGTYLILTGKKEKRFYLELFNFSPEGYNLPLEYKKLIAFCKSEEKHGSAGNKEIWICKPVGLSQGRGISLFQVSNTQRFFVGKDYLFL